MNREIKFRAWTKKDNCWIGGFCIHQTGLFSETGLFSDIINAKIEEQNDIIVMQYTDLKDKNGKEIYEGDVVEFRIYDEKGKDKVVFNKGRFMLKNEYNDLYLLSETEIIGNIYENPELLKQL